VLLRLRKVLDRPGFSVKEIARKVSYAGDIAGFCIAMATYAEVLITLQP